MKIRRRQSGVVGDQLWLYFSTWVIALLAAAVPWLIRGAGPTALLGFALLFPAGLTFWLGDRAMGLGYVMYFVHGIVTLFVGSRKQCFLLMYAALVIMLVVNVGGCAWMAVHPR